MLPVRVTAQDRLLLGLPFGQKVLARLCDGLGGYLVAQFLHRLLGQDAGGRCRQGRRPERDELVLQVDEARQLVLDLDLLQRRPVACIRAFECRIGETLDREFHVLGRHLTITVSEADVVLQCERHSNIIELLYAVHCHGLPAPGVSRLRVHHRGKYRPDDVVLGQRQSECRIDNLQVRVRPDRQHLAVLRHRHARHCHGRSAESPCRGKERTPRNPGYLVSHWF